MTVERRGERREYNRDESQFVMILQTDVSTKVFRKTNKSSYQLSAIQLLEKKNMLLLLIRSGQKCRFNYRELTKLSFKVCIVVICIISILQTGRPCWSNND